MVFFSSTTLRENKDEIINKSVNTKINNEPSDEFSFVDSEKN
jgi:hypothetical protein